MKHLASLLLLILLAAGCSYKPAEPPMTVAVGGKVILVSGSPLTGGRVVFKPKEAGKQEAVGEINPDGSYKLTSYIKDDGAVPGEYTVVIEKISYKTGNAVEVRLPVAAKYLSSRTSDLSVTVKQGGDYPIRLK